MKKTFEGTVRQSGTSKVITLYSALVKKMKLKNGQIVTITIETEV